MSESETIELTPPVIKQEDARLRKENRYALALQHQATWDELRRINDDSTTAEEEEAILNSLLAKKGKERKD